MTKTKNMFDKPFMDLKKEQNKVGSKYVSETKKTTKTFQGILGKKTKKVSAGLAYDAKNMGNEFVYLTKSHKKRKR